MRSITIQLSQEDLTDAEAIVAGVTSIEPGVVAIMMSRQYGLKVEKVSDSSEDTGGWPSFKFTGEDKSIAELAADAGEDIEPESGDGGEPPAEAPDMELDARNESAESLVDRLLKGGR